MTRRLAIAATLLCAVPLTACWGVPQHDPVTWSDANDPEMNAARAEAVRRLPEFFARLASPQAGDQEFVLKFDLNQNPDDPEFIWAGDIVVAAGQPIRGRLLNDPINPSFSEGQLVDIGDTDIIDWGFRRNGVMQGNFTTRVQISQMPAEQAQAVRESLGW
jgi:uncharacterized protein YegJ (DUF2314 family)